MLPLLALLSLGAHAQDIPWTGFTAQYPATPPAGIAVLFHGLGGDDSVFTDHWSLTQYQRAFSLAGYITLAIEAPNRDGGTWDCEECLDNALDPMMDTLLGFLEPEQQRVIYLGYSAGTHPATTQAMRDPLATGLILLQGRGAYRPEHVHGPDADFPVLMTTRLQDETVPSDRVWCAAARFDTIPGLTPELFAIPGSHAPSPVFIRHLFPILDLPVPEWAPYRPLLPPPPWPTDVAEAQALCGEPD